MILLILGNFGVGKQGIFEFLCDEDGSKGGMYGGTWEITMAGVGYYFTNISKVWFGNVLEMFVGVCGKCNVEMYFKSP